MVLMSLIGNVGVQKCVGQMISMVLRDQLDWQIGINYYQIVRMDIIGRICCICIIRWLSKLNQMNSILSTCASYYTLVQTMMAYFDGINSYYTNGYSNDCFRLDTRIKK